MVNLFVVVRVAQLSLRMERAPRTKGQATRRLLDWIATQNGTGLKLKRLHGDRGGEFLNNALAPPAQPTALHSLLQPRLATTKRRG